MERVINGKLLKYENGEIYTWREKWRGYNHTAPSWVKKTGGVNKLTGYRHYGVGSKIYQGHRLVYALHNPDWDLYDNSRSNLIDHIDQDRLNNDIHNLRVVSHVENLWNTKARGCSWHKAKKQWVAKIKIHGEKCQRTLGYFDTEEEGHQAYLEAKKIYHQIGALTTSATPASPSASSHSPLPSVASPAASPHSAPPAHTTHTDS
mgnify:CR=1 FL=1